MKFHALLVFAVLVLVAAAAAACGGNSKSPNLTAAAATNAANDTFDYSLLNAVVLQSGDMPPGYNVESGFAPKGGPAVAFNTRSTYGPITVTATVARFPDVAARDKTLDRTRRGLAVLVGPESNLNVPGSDAAFMYRNTSPAAQASLVLRGEFQMTVVMQTHDQTQTAEVTNQNDLKRYTAIVFERLSKLIDAPESLTPIAAFPTYDAGAPPTPSPPGTP